MYAKKYCFEYAKKAKQCNRIHIASLATGSLILFICLRISIFSRFSIAQDEFRQFFLFGSFFYSVRERFISFFFENWMQFKFRFSESQCARNTFFCHRIARFTWADQWTHFQQIHRVPLILGGSLEVWSKSLFISSLLLSSAIQTVWIWFISQFRTDFELNEIHCQLNGFSSQSSMKCFWFMID